MADTRRYLIRKWHWNTDVKGRPFWEAPLAKECFGALDLRTLAECGTPAVGDGVGLFIYDRSQPVLVGDLDLGDDLQSIIKKSDRDSLRALLGITDREQSTRLLDILWDALTIHADPTGEARVKPIMPDKSGVVSLYVGGHPLLRSRMVTTDAPEWEVVKECYQLQYRELKEAVDAGELPKGFDQSMLTVWEEKFPKVDPTVEFIPDDLPQVEPLPHSTTITDNFNGTDGTAIGNLLTWSDVTGTWVKNANKASKSTNTSTQQNTRAEFDLSGVDHNAKANFEGDNASCQGPLVRFATAANTCYCTMPFAGTLYLQKCVTGTYSTITTASATWNSGDEYKLDVSGSNLTSSVNGSPVIGPYSDGSISTGTRCGLTAYKTYAENGSGSSAENFSASDAGGGGGGTTFNGRRSLLGVGR